MKTNSLHKSYLIASFISVFYAGGFAQQTAPVSSDVFYADLQNNIQKETASNLPEKIFAGTEEFDPSAEKYFLSDSPEAVEFLKAIDGRNGPKTIAQLDFYSLPPSNQRKIFFCQSPDKLKPDLAAMR